MKRAVTLACAALLLSSCGSDKAEPKEPDPTPSASAEAAPTPPPLASEPTIEGAATFAIYFSDVLGHESRVGTSDALRELSATSCAECLRLAEAIDQIYANGGYLRTATWVLTDLKSGINGTSGTVEANVLTAEGEYKVSKDSATVTDPETEARLTFRMTHDGTSWQMADIVREGSS